MRIQWGSWRDRALCSNRVAGKAAGGQSFPVNAKSQRISQLRGGKQRSVGIEADELHKGGIRIRYLNIPHRAVGVLNGKIGYHQVDPAGGELVVEGSGSDTFQQADPIRRKIGRALMNF